MIDNNSHTHNSHASSFKAKLLWVYARCLWLRISNPFRNNKDQVIMIMRFAFFCALMIVKLYIHCSILSNILRAHICAHLLPGNISYTTIPQCLCMKAKVLQCYAQYKARTHEDKLSFSMVLLMVNYSPLRKAHPSVMIPWLAHLHQHSNSLLKLLAYSIQRGRFHDMISEFLVGNNVLQNVKMLKVNMYIEYIFAYYRYT